ncbi:MULTISPECIES: class I SAM-dependent methyltransferase [unclassified Virgibacillus]|uniref:class I SAM-dependent DNA methyltransferase n=1 Tax=unclassified Virgibacillus TaxID=2620237 RepID=UPI0024DE87B3|nr:class I SAM-dependent methyltransferase [Virgibacillus sp. LDC-1]
MAYERMANIYDQFMKDAPYDDWVSFTEEFIARSPLKVTSILDLGCGTGEIALRLAQKGYAVTGVDYSADMLSIAEQKANDQHLDIHWVHQDLRALDGFTMVDVAVCYCDVVNYITTTEELEQVFGRVSKALRPGGLFLFDVHSLFHVEHNLVNQTFADIDEESSYIWFCSEGDEKGSMYHDLTFFMQDGSQYTRFDEAHYQRTYSMDVYTALLQQAGFEINQITADFSLENKKIDEKAARLFFIAEKRSG